MTETIKLEGEGTKENVAFKLLQLVALREKLSTRKEILDAYTECLEAAFYNRGR